MQPQALNDEETDDEDNLGNSFEPAHLQKSSSEHERGSPITTPVVAATAMNQQSSEHSPRKLGTIGGAKASHTSLAVSLAKQGDQFSGTTTSPSTQFNTLISEPDQPRPALNQPSPRKVGQIGGHATAASTLSSQSTLQGSVPRKLGSIGGRASAPTPNPVPNDARPRDESFSRQTSPSTSTFPAQTSETTNTSTLPENVPIIKPILEKSPAPRESSLERADRRRAELKRELEEQSKTHTKKKRRF